MLNHRPPSRCTAVAALLLSSAFILSGCEYSRMSTINPAGSHAQNIYDLLIPIAWAALAVFILVEGLLVYSVVRFRRRSQSMPVQVHGNTKVEIMWTIAPALIVLVIAVLTFRTQAINSVQPPDALKITATGHQWWFQVDYPSLGITTANDVYIPVGRPVTFQLEAQDVMHNFWIPRLAGKTYMIPTKTNYLSFTANEPGIYLGQCAEFCGTEHAMMKFRVVALAQADFDKWVSQQYVPPVQPAGARQPTPLPRATAVPAQAGQPTPAPAPAAPAAALPSDPAARGQVLFIRKGCIGCHAVNGFYEAKGVTGPNLTYFGNRETVAAGWAKNTDANLHTWLYDPNAVKPGNIMSTVIKGPSQGSRSLQDPEIDALVAYLESMKFPINKPADK